MGASLSLSLSESSVNQANNTSVVTAVLYVKSTNGTYNQVDSCTGTIKIDGTSYSFKHYFAKNTTTKLATKSKTVTHNADGTKTVSVSASYKTGVSPGTISTSKSIKLTNITRKFTVALNAQGGSVSSTSYTKVYGTSLSLPTPTRTGYTFGGWCTGTNGTGTNYNTTYTANAAATLYAKWTERTATLTYNNGGRGTTPAAVTMRYTAATTAASISATGYTFDGWWTGGAGSGTRYNIGATVKSANVIPSALTLTAKWTANPYDIHYDSNGGSGTLPDDQDDILYDSTVLIGSGENLTKLGYTFVGWSTNPEAESPQYSANTSYKWTTASDVILYAVWVPTIIDIIFYRNALEKNFSDPNSYVELYTGNTVQFTDYTLPTGSSAITAPNINNYTFTGYWTKDRPNSKIYTEYGISFPAGIIPYNYNNSQIAAEGFLTEGSTITGVESTVYLYPVYKDNTVTLVSTYTDTYNYINDTVTESMYFKYVSGQLSSIPLSVVDDDVIACLVYRTAVGASGVSLDLSSVEAELWDAEHTLQESIELNNPYFNKVVNASAGFSDLYLVFRTTGQSGGKLINPETTNYVLTISGVKDSFGKSIPSTIINIYPPKIVRDVNTDGDVVSFFEEAPDYTASQKSENGKHIDNEIRNNGIIFSKNYLLDLPDWEESETYDENIYQKLSEFGWDNTLFEDSDTSDTAVKLKEFLSNVLDISLVIEEGTEGIWTWRKWSDGTAECWGKHTATISITGAWGTGVYTGGAFTENYPSGLFAAAPYILTTTEGDSSYASWLYTQNTGSKDTTPQFVFGRGASDGGSKTYTANMYAIGKWANINPTTHEVTAKSYIQEQMTKAEIRALIEASGNQFKDNNIWIPSDLT